MKRVSPRRPLAPPRSIWGTMKVRSSARIEQFGQNPVAGDLADDFALIAYADGGVMALSLFHHLLDGGVWGDAVGGRTACGFHHIARTEYAEGVHVRHKFGHITGRGIGEDILRRAALHDPTAFHDGDATTEFEGLVKVVADEDDRAAEGFLQV